MFFEFVDVLFFRFYAYVCIGVFMCIRIALQILILGFFFFHVQSDFSRVFFVRLEFKRLRRRYCLSGSF